jgi:glycerate kinase
MVVLVAPNAFKHALTADKAALAIERGVFSAGPGHRCIRHPVADGGDGTGERLISHFSAERIPHRATGPLGDPVDAWFGWRASDRTAIIDMSTASGIRLIPRERLDPTVATSLGTGELLRRALDMGARRILVGMGGSATVDGGMGILQALGAVFLDADGRILQTPGELTRLAAIDLSQWDMRTLETDISILCDVDNPLCGPDGAAAVFGPQKGATPEMVARLDAGLACLRETALALTGRDMAGVPHAGTAGGAAAGLHALAAATPVNGIEQFLDITAFEDRLREADIVVTGEGSLDSQTLNGKGPFGVARRAKALGKTVIGLAGRVDDPEGLLKPHFDILHDINNGPVTDLDAALARTEQNLQQAMHDILTRP